MNRRRLRLGSLALVAIISIVTTLAYVLLTREPVHQGKPVSDWFDQFNTTNRSQAAIALREIGPAAVPVLLKKARSNDGVSLHDKVYRTIYNKAPSGWKRRMSLPKPVDGIFDYRVANALQLLGPAALPQLLEGMADHNSNVRLTSLRAVKLIRPKTESLVPAFTRLVNDRDGRIRVEAILALHGIGPAKKLAMAELIGALNDSDRGPRPNEFCFVRAAAALALGEIGPEAKSALPGLTRVLSATNSYTRIQAAIAIWRIAADTNMIPTLIAELDTTPDVPTCSWILSAFGEMGPVAKPAIPAMLRKLQGSRGVSNAQGIDLSAVGLRALNKIDPVAAVQASEK